MSKLIHIDQDYKQWIQDLKSRYRRSQIKASVKVNYEVLSFYWQLGRDIVNLDAENRWGSGFMRMLSQDLKQELPEATGLTQRNLYYCKKFYLLYNQANANLPQVGAELKPTTPGQIVPQVEGKLQDEKLPQLLGQKFRHSCLLCLGDTINTSWTSAATMPRKRSSMSVKRWRTAGAVLCS